MPGMVRRRIIRLAAGRSGAVLAVGSFEHTVRAAARSQEVSDASLLSEPVHELLDGSPNLRYIVWARTAS